MTRAILSVVILVCLIALHPGIALAAALVVYAAQGRRVRPKVPKATLLRPPALPTRTEVLAERFTRLG